MGRTGAIALAAAALVGCSGNHPSPRDAAPPPDLAVDDLSTAPPDLAARDLAVDAAPPPPDLTASHDFPSPPDLAGVDLVGYPVAHTALPQVARNHGVALTHVRLVTITWDGYAYRDQVEAWGAFLFTSNYWKLVGADYGLGDGAQAATVHLGAAPATTTTKQLIDMLEGLFTAGLAPAPTSSNTDQYFYVLYPPASTTVTDNLNGNGVFCQADFSGFHEGASFNGQLFPFAVVADCGSGVDDITAAASHEIVEGAADPYDPPNDGWYVNQPLPDPWYTVTENEIADLCNDENDVHEAGWALQPIWSNAAAAAGRNPCVPETSWPFYDLDVQPASAPTVVSGATATTTTFQVRGWSLGPVADFPIAVAAADYSDVKLSALKPQLSGAALNNGTSVTLTLTIPPNLASGKVGAVQVYSTEFPSRFWPVAYVVQ